MSTKRTALILGLILTIAFVGGFVVFYLYDYLKNIGIIIPSLVWIYLAFGLFLGISIYGYYKLRNAKYYSFIAFITFAYLYITLNEVLLFYAIDYLLHFIIMLLTIIGYLWIVIIIGYYLFNSQSPESKKFIEFIHLKRRKKQFEATID